MKRLKTKFKKVWNKAIYYFGLLILMCWFLPAHLHAQAQIDGRVIDGENQPLIGATILEKGTFNGTVTDNNGKFSLNIPDSGAVLVISYVGYITEEVEAKGSGNIEVILVADITNIDDIVVIGYGAQKKRDLTGAISTIDNERLNDIPATNLTGALQGSVPD